MEFLVHKVSLVASGREYRWLLVLQAPSLDVAGWRVVALSSLERDLAILDHQDTVKAYLIDVSVVYSGLIEPSPLAADFEGDSDLNLTVG